MKPSNSNIKNRKTQAVKKDPPAARQLRLAQELAPLSGVRQ
jgi:hypothetical protein